jgi:hypothetical protein
MAQLIRLDTFSSDNGCLTVFEKVLPGTVQRVFYIYNVGDQARAGHRHVQAWNALICVSGRCEVYNNNGDDEETYVLDSPDLCLVLEPRDWHVMDRFSEGAVLLVMSNELYDKADYIYEPYPSRVMSSSL